MARHVLIVDDDTLMRRSVSLHLEQNGFRASTAASAEDALALARRDRPDLVLLDIGLPGMDGLDALRHLRRQANLPVIFVTARRRELEQVLGLELGADDYVTKPFSITELLARVRAVLRRTTSRPPTEDTVRIGDLEVDFKLHQARREKRRVEFTAREFELLRYFVQHKGKVVTREQILNEVWGYEEFPTTRTIDNFVAKLRQKIERAPHEPEHILTIHGSGYKFVG